MSKAPAIQFYVGDYVQDTRMISLAARGAWMDLLCAMWRSSTRGRITSSTLGYARLFGCTVEQARAVIDEITEAQICDSVTLGDGKVTLTNRRMYREARERDRGNLRQKNYRERLKNRIHENVTGEGDARVTPPSSSSSTQQQQPPARAREGPPPKHPATQIYITVFDFPPPIFGQEQIESEVNREFIIWADVCKLWKGNNHDPEKVGNLIDRWRREVKKAEEAAKKRRDDGANNGSRRTRGGSYSERNEAALEEVFGPGDERCEAAGVEGAHQRGDAR